VNRTHLPIIALAALLTLVVAPPAFSADGTVSLAGLTFDSWDEAFNSEDFRAAEARCATPDRETRVALYGIPEGGDPGDCTASSTNPDPAYAPNAIYEIPVVVHILMNDDGSLGDFSDAEVQTQIDILNEDFLALTGTNAENGNYGAIQFALATVDPGGSPTTGITRTQNTSWFNDSGTYYNTLAWDPNRYMNIYTNQASGNLGYVPFLPADAGGTLVGGSNDRVVILYTTFGRNAPFAPFNLGRTGTHEVGHYLGLEHTFSGGCGSSGTPGCYGDGDLVCDTNPEASPTFNCPASRTSCSLPSPFDNYMDYSDDICMEQFTPEQVLRMRCSMEYYRPNLYTVVNPRVTIFGDGFEAGNTTAWDNVVAL